MTEFSQHLHYAPITGNTEAQNNDTRVFHSLYKVGRNGNFVFKGFNNSKKSFLQ